MDAIVSADLRNLTQRAQRKATESTERSTAKEGGVGIEHEKNAIDSCEPIAVDMLAPHGHFWLRLRSAGVFALNVFRSLSARAFPHRLGFQWLMRWGPRAVPV